MPRATIDAVRVSNMALRHLAIGKEIQSLTERTEEARACNLFFEMARDETLNDFHWPFAKAYAALALVAGTASVPATLDFQYSYRYPIDALYIRRVVSGISRTEADDERIPYRIGRDANGGLIYTDFEAVAATTTLPAQPQCEYTMVVDDPTTWNADFAQCVAFKLAFYIAPSLTAGDPFKLGNRAYAAYQNAMGEAQAMAMNEEQPDLPPDADLIRARS